MYWCVGVVRVVKISAILQQDAFMPCETRHSLLDWHLLPPDSEGRFTSDRINLILWYRQGGSVPFYTVDARPLNQIVASGQKIDPTVLANPIVHHSKNDSRYEFDLGKLTPILRITNISETDEGMYECRVEYASQRTFTTMMQLTVIGKWFFVPYS